MGLHFLYRWVCEILARTTETLSHETKLLFFLLKMSLFGEGEGMDVMLIIELAKVK